jgi:hypothetical protein
MRLFSGVVASLILLGASAMADSPTIQNNDFEMPVIGPPYVSQAAVPGWSHTRMAVAPSRSQGTGISFC